MPCHGCPGDEPIRPIEPKTSSRLQARSIRNQLKEMSPVDICQQAQSRVFSVPPEIRNLIYTNAFQCSQIRSACRWCGTITHDARSEDSSKQGRLIETALLRTCRIVFYEAKSLPLRLTTLHSCPATLGRLRDRISSKLTAQNVLYLHEVHLAAQTLGDLLLQLREFTRLAHFQPTGLVLHAGVGNSDHWRDLMQSGLNVDGTFPPTVQRVRLELRCSDADLESWRVGIESMQPLQLSYSCGHRLIQRREVTASRSLDPLASSVLTAMVILEAITQPVPAGSDSTTATKLKPHLNHASKSRQVLRLVPAESV